MIGWVGWVCVEEVWKWYGVVWYCNDCVGMGRLVLDALVLRWDGVRGATDRVSVGFKSQRVQGTVGQ